MKIAIVMPALDEEKAIGDVLRSIPLDPALDVRRIVVDNGSTDRTAEIARECGAEVVRENERGYGAACQTGIARAGDTDVIVILDADGAEDPGMLPHLLEPILGDHADFVLGSRSLGVAEKGALPPQVRFGNALVTFLIRLFYGHRYTDMGPFRAIRKTAYDRLCMRDRNFGWNVEMQIKAVKKGLRVMEIPVPYRRRVGKSKISGTIKGTVMAGTKMLYAVVRYGLFS
jgi:glycosyltransferase involved in cell wall biosynthesis